MAQDANLRSLDCPNQMDCGKKRGGKCTSIPSRLPSHRRLCEQGLAQKRLAYTSRAISPHERAMALLSKIDNIPKISKIALFEPFLGLLRLKMPWIDPMQKSTKSRADEIGLSFYKKTVRHASLRSRTSSVRKWTPLSIVHFIKN